ncbi:ABC transporter permease [Paenibacillus tyrfis]|uniref:ABC transporter permease n=1 Tax=Paenibacillus tyrfis TaxID=1501230 RepID=A0A081P0M2_9BACL|nr:ABC transporter permease [Paenibacillus tyrfis]KEQ24245.1 hypothetical protein ET33_11185 [Paenibacillus tyrfis]
MTIFLRNIVKEWTYRPLAFSLLLVGYVIGIVVLSFGISVAQASRTMALESVSGSPEHFELIHANFQEGDSNIFSDIKKIALDAGKYAEIQVGIDSKINEKEHVVLGVHFEILPEWQTPLISGKQFDANDLVGGEKVAVIGKQVADEYFPEGLKKNSYINVNGEQYNIIGVVGKETRQTQWDDNIYVPLKALQNSSSRQSTYHFLVRTNDKKPTEEVNRMISEITKTAEKIQISTEKPHFSSKESEFWSNILVTAILSGIILLVTVINVSNLTLFWIVERRNEIGILKAIGATNWTIARQITCEMLFICFLSAIISILVQSCITYVFNAYKWLATEITVSWSNWIISFGIATICGLVTSITPVNKCLKVAPSEVLKQE